MDLTQHAINFAITVYLEQNEHGPHGDAVYITMAKHVIDLAIAQGLVYEIEDTYLIKGAI